MQEKENEFSFKALTELKKQYDNKIQKDGKKIILNGFKEFFDKYPQVKGIGLYGYTPSFNDGNPCTFSLCEMYLAFDQVLIDQNVTDFEDEFIYEDENDDEASACWQTSSDLVVEKLRKDFDKLYENFLAIEDVFESVFGSGFKLIASQEGLHIEEYYDY